MGSTARRVTALVASVSMLLGLAACGQTKSADDNGNNNTTTAATEPSEGTPISQTDLPMPDKTKAYNNPLSRDEIKDGGELTLAISEIGPDWNALSVTGNTVYMSALWRLYMPHLIDLNVDGSKIEPATDYVTSMKQISADPETIEFTFNDKATWNDGTPITWKDLEATWKVCNGSDEAYTPASTTGWDQIESVTRGDTDKKAIVTFAKDKPYYPWQSLFGLLYPAQALEGGADTYTQGWQNEPHNEWAAGPFKVEAHSDTEVSFVPNEKWWGDKPKLDRITFRQMESSASVNAFKNGEIDATSAGTADRLKQVQSVEDAYLRRSYDLAVNTYTINGKAEFLSDVNVRKALVQAIDRTQMAKIKFNGLSWEEETPNSMVMLPFQAGYEDNMPADAVEADSAKAQKTLEEAGYTKGSDGYFQKDGKTIKIAYVTFSDDPTIKAMAQAFQKMAKEGGIKVDIEIKPSNDFSDVLASGDFGVIGMGWSFVDPYGYSSAAYQFYGSDSQSNYSFVGTKELDEELLAITSTEDTDKALSMFNKTEKKVMEQYTQIPMYNGVQMFAVKKGLANFGPAGFAANYMGLPNRPQDMGWQK